MSKKKKNKTRKQIPNPKSKRVVKKKPPTIPKPDLLARGSMASERDVFYRKIFRIAALSIAVITILMALQSGVNGDDEFQNDYSTKLVNYYLSGGADTEALFIEKGNMHYYGGFFDLLTGLVNKAMGLTDYDESYHRVRHFFNAIFGWICMLFVGLLAREIAGWRAGILALVFMFLSPRFLGHSLMNPKDIPFAAGFAIALYYTTRLLKQLPELKWQTGIGIALGLGLALATRAGGLLLVPYLGLAMGLDFLLRFGFQGISKNLERAMLYLGYLAGVSIVGYVFAILTWPAALADPLGHPLKALTEFSDLGIKIRLLFMGQNVMSDATVWYYPIVWIFKTVPLFVLTGFAGSVILLPKLYKSFAPVPIILLFFATIFPVFYVIIKDSILHDGWRHLMFIYPSMVVLASLFWLSIEKLLDGNQTGTYALYAIVGLMLLESTIFIARNTNYPYVYFNGFSGGIGNAFGEFETDYWGVSAEQALDWMEDEGILDQSSTDTITIGTNFYYPVSRRVNRKYQGKVRTKYVRFNRRYSEQWDYGIFPSRYIRSKHLKSGNWPNSKAIHVIKSNGVPLTAIEKQENDHAYQAEVAVKNKNWVLAEQLFQQELSNYPDNELAWLGLSNAQLNQNKLDEALTAAQKSLEVAPQNENGLYYKALAKLRAGDVAGATSAFFDVLAVNDEFYIANYYLAVIYQQGNKLNEALQQALKSVETNPKFKAGYELVAGIYQAMGDTNNANRYRQAANSL